MNFNKAREEMQTDIRQFIHSISNNKDVHKNNFSEWKNHTTLLVDKKNHTPQDAIMPTSVTLTLNEYEVANTMFLLKIYFFMYLPIMWRYIGKIFLGRNYYKEIKS